MKRTVTKACDLIMHVVATQVIRAWLYFHYSGEEAPNSGSIFVSVRYWKASILLFELSKKKSVYCIGFLKIRVFYIFTGEDKVPW